jgi:hypothetical protein
VWVTGVTEAAWDGRLIQLNAETGDILQTVNLSGDPRDIAVTANAVWVLNMTKPGESASSTGLELLRVDPAAGLVTASVQDVFGFGVSTRGLWILQDLGQGRTGLVELDPSVAEPVGSPAAMDSLAFAGDHGALGTLVVGPSGVWSWRTDTDDTVLLVRAGASDASLSLGTVRSSQTWPLDAVLDEAGTLWVASLQGVTRVDGAG